MSFWNWRRALVRSPFWILRAKRSAADRSHCANWEPFGAAVAGEAGRTMPAEHARASAAAKNARLITGTSIVRSGHDSAAARSGCTFVRH